MREEFSGIGSKLFIGNKDTGEVFSLDLQTNEAIRLRKSYEEEERDRIKAKQQSMPPGIIMPTEDGGFVLQKCKSSTGFSFSGTCELPDSAEAEALRDMMRRETPEMEFDIQILPSLYKKCYVRAPRKMLKAMNHGGYYKRNTKWKRKAIALFNRYPEQSPFTIGRARVETDDQGCILILSRKISKTQILKTK